MLALRELRLALLVEDNRVHWVITFQKLPHGASIDSGTYPVIAILKYIPKDRQHVSIVVHDQDVLDGWHFFHTPLLSASLYEPISRLGRARRFPIFDDPHHVHERPQLAPCSRRLARVTRRLWKYPNELGMHEVDRDRIGVVFGFA